MRVDPENNMIVPETDRERLKYMDLAIQFDMAQAEKDEHNRRIMELGKKTEGVWKEFNEMAVDLEGLAFTFNRTERRFYSQCYDVETNLELQAMQAKITQKTSETMLETIRKEKEKEDSE